MTLGSESGMMRALCEGLDVDRSRPESLPIVLQRIRSFLEGTSAIDAVAYWTQQGVGWMNGHAGEIDHVGFIGPVGSNVADLIEVVKAAGFSTELHAFPSVIIARELGQLRSVPLVPTTILMAHGTTSHGRRIGVELFLPAEDPALVKSWIEADVATHLAVTMAQESFRAVKSALEADGFRVPAFKHDEPLTSLPQPDGRKFLSMYLERRRAAKFSRLELCGLVDRVTASIFPAVLRGDTNDPS